MSIQRQLRDIVHQGEKFKSTNAITEESVESFNNYSQELKLYLSRNSQNELVIERLKNIHPVSYSKAVLPFWYFLLLPFIPYYLYLLWEEYNKKQICQDQLLELVSIFSSIEFLMRSE